MEDENHEPTLPGFYRERWQKNMYMKIILGILDHFFNFQKISDRPF